MIVGPLGFDRRFLLELGFDRYMTDAPCRFHVTQFVRFTRTDRCIDCVADNDTAPHHMSQRQAKIAGYTYYHRLEVCGHTLRYVTPDLCVTCYTQRHPSVPGEPA